MCDISRCLKKLLLKIGGNHDTEMRLGRWLERIEDLLRAAGVTGEQMFS